MWPPTTSLRQSSPAGGHEGPLQSTRAGASNEIAERIHQDNPRAAAAFARRVDALAALLARHPEDGRKTNLSPVRVMPLRPYPYLLFYQPAEAGGIVILRVRHMARKEDWRTGR